MHKRQAGVTFIGWIILLIPMAIVLYSAIRLVPLYLNQMRVVRSIEQAAEEARNDTSVDPRQIRDTLEKRLDIEGVEFPSVSDIRVAREGEGWVIEANYERVAPLFAGIQLLVTFDKRETIP